MQELLPFFKSWRSARLFRGASEVRRRTGETHPAPRFVRVRTNEPAEVSRSGCGGRQSVVTERAGARSSDNGGGGAAQGVIVATASPSDDRPPQAESIRGVRIECGKPETLSRGPTGSAHVPIGKP